MTTHSGILAWRIPWTDEPALASRMFHLLVLTSGKSAVSELSHPHHGGNDSPFTESFVGKICCKVEFSPQLTTGAKVDGHENKGKR